MAKFFDIPQALIASVKAFMQTNNDTTPVSWPDAELTEAQKPEGLWLQVNHVPGDSIPVTLSGTGEDNNLGFLQIDANYPRDSGEAHVLKALDPFATYYEAGKKIQGNGVQVNILSCSISPGRFVGAYYRMSISINYYARTFRNQT